jgi:hypothetical protein
MAIEYLDPRSAPSLPADQYDLGIDLAMNGLTVGLLANGFPDSSLFLNELGSTLKARYPNIVTHIFVKENATTIAHDSLLNTITSNCKAVITAYGH